MVITSLFDNVANRYLGIVVNYNESAALRDFKNEIARAYGDDSSALFVSPGDFDLYSLGDFDSSTGVITPCNPVCIGKGSQVFDMVDREVSNGYEENYE